MTVEKGRWVKLEQKGTGPGARSSSTITIVGNKVYAFSGEFIPVVPIDSNIHIFDLKTQIWSIPEVTGDVPTPRIGHTMNSIGGTIYLFGGRDTGKKRLDELYAFDTSTNHWTLLSTGDSGPSHRSYHSSAADDRHVYVFGGCSNTGRENDLWAYDVVDKKWTEYPPPGPTCTCRGGPGLVVAQGKIWVLYGFSGVELDDVFYFDLADKTWAQVETSGEKPSPRSVFSTAAIGQHIIVYGGEEEPSELMHLGAGKFSREVYGLDSETLAWKRLDDGSGFDEHPGERGWCAFAGGSLNGKQGLWVYGGNSPTNDRLGDIFFFSPGFDGVDD